MSRNRHRWSSVVALCAASLLATACSSSGSGSESTSTLRVGVVNQFQHPNPFNAFNIIDYSYQQMTLPALVQYDEEGKVIPDLALSWTTAADGLTWTFKLVPGAKWSDGEPLTAKDVAFTFNTIIKYVKGPTAIDSQNITNLNSVSAPDPETAVFHYSAPMAAALAYINNTSILPEHVWGKYATGDGAGLKTFANKPPSVSGGPFTPVSWDGSSFLMLKRNPNFYGEKPAYGGMGIKYYTTPDGLIQDLKRKKIDYANAIPQSSLGLS